MKMASAVPNRRTLVRVEITDAEKRRVPSKHYSYVINITWSDRSETVIYRRYSKFFEFQIILLETFPWEGGLKEPSDRIIPFLPGKILFGRSHVRDVAMKRLKPIDKYCKAIVGLPAHISCCDHVLDFFETQHDDINPVREDSRRKLKDEQEVEEISGPILLEPYVAIADYTRTEQKELSITVGQRVEVIEKNENGWWFISDEEGERGWVPGVYLEKPDGSVEDLVTKKAEPGHGERYITTQSYEAETADDLRFGAGVEVEVLQKNLEGWWLVSYNGRQGHAPASYLEKSRDRMPGTKVKSKPSTGDTKQCRNLLVSGSSSTRFPPHRPAVSVRNKVSPKEPVSQGYPRVKTVQPPPKRSSIKRTYPKRPNAPPRLSTPQNEEAIYEYMTTMQFKANIPDGVSFDKEEKVEVIEKSPGGWWFIKIGRQEGWAPASYIEKRDAHAKPKPVAPPSRPRPPKLQKSNLSNETTAISSCFTGIVSTASNSGPKKITSSSTSVGQSAVLPAKRLVPALPDSVLRRPLSETSKVNPPRPLLFSLASTKTPNRSAEEQSLKKTLEARPADFRSAQKSRAAAMQNEIKGMSGGPPSRPSSGPASMSNGPKVKVEGLGSSAHLISKPKITPSIKNTSVHPKNSVPLYRPPNLAVPSSSLKIFDSNVKTGPKKLQQLSKTPENAHKPPPKPKPILASGKPKAVLYNAQIPDGGETTNFRNVLRSTHEKQSVNNTKQSRSIANKVMDTNANEQQRKLPPSVPKKPSDLMLKPPLSKKINRPDEAMADGEENTSVNVSTERRKQWNSEVSRPALRRFQLNNNSNAEVLAEKSVYTVGHAKSDLTN